MRGRQTGAKRRLGATPKAHTRDLSRERAESASHVRAGAFRPSRAPRRDAQVDCRGCRHSGCCTTFRMFTVRRWSHIEVWRCHASADNMKSPSAATSERHRRCCQSTVFKHGSGCAPSERAFQRAFHDLLTSSMRSLTSPCSSSCGEGVVAAQHLSSVRACR